MRTDPLKSARRRPLREVMHSPLPRPAPSADARELVHGLLERCLREEELAVPLLPEVARRVLRARSDRSMDARRLAQIVNADPALSLHLLRIVGSAARRPLTPILSLPHAVAWLGVEEVANIVFTLAVQGRMLEVPGQQHKVRALWRHSLASALWAQQLARLLGRDAGLCHLCGLLHHIGKAVTLGAARELAERAGCKLTGEDYDTLVETFHRPVGARVVTAWAMPEPVIAVIMHWEAYPSAGALRVEGNVVNAAQRLAQHTLRGTGGFERDLAAGEPVFLDLALPADAAAELLGAAPQIHAEVDQYLAP